MIRLELVIIAITFFLGLIAPSHMIGCRPKISGDVGLSVAEIRNKYGSGDWSYPKEVISNWTECDYIQADLALVYVNRKVGRIPKGDIFIFRNGYCTKVIYER